MLSTKLKFFAFVELTSLQIQSSCLGLKQEVTESFLNIVLAHPWVRCHFLISDATGSTCVPYGVLLLVSVSHPLLCSPMFRLHQMPSNMGRRLLVAEFSVSDHKPDCSAQLVSSRGLFRVCTAHLESLDNSDIRLSQLEHTIIPELTSTADSFKPPSPASASSSSTLLGDDGQNRQLLAAIFAGDTNFGTDCAEAKLLEEWNSNSVHCPRISTCNHSNSSGVGKASGLHVFDVWRALHGDFSARATHTMLDGTLGRLDKVLLAAPPSPPPSSQPGSSAASLQTRPDEEKTVTAADADVADSTKARETNKSLRHLSKAELNVKPTSIALIGDEPIGEDEKGRPIFCSDHVGVVAKFKLEFI